ncbi:MAG TPA: HEAT repeat domain-containing protein [Gemmataceae bacterium]|jgi:HEAT repeat protein|nr:HEAT repeat domain-containing protein [Gemmataceae bacterium]
MKRNHCLQQQSSRPRLGLAQLAVALCLPLCGCASFWDDVTSREFSFHEYFNKPNPLLVLHDSTDGDRRARALRALQEPKQHGGTDQDQEAVLKILTTAASSENQPLCRLAAIQSLGHFKDPRAVEGLTAAFFNAGAFLPETATMIRAQAVTALGETRNPVAVDMLVRVVKEPPAEGPDADKQLTLDVRIAAARALGNYSQYQATEALLHVLQGEKDVALRDCAHKSLQLATGKDLPPDAKQWEAFLRQANTPNLAANPPKPPKHFGIF